MAFYAFGIILLQLLTVEWLLIMGFSAIDLTLIGHLLNWKKIKCPKWCGWFYYEKYFGYKELMDLTTHPQVVIKLVTDVLVFAGLFCFFVNIGSIITSIVTPLFWILDCIFLFLEISIPLSLRIIAHKLFKKRRNDDVFKT